MEAPDTPEYGVNQILAFPLFFRFINSEVNSEVNCGVSEA